MRAKTNYLRHVRGDVHVVDGEYHHLGGESSEEQRGDHSQKEPFLQPHFLLSGISSYMPLERDHAGPCSIPHLSGPEAPERSPAFLTAQSDKGRGTGRRAEEEKAEKEKQLERQRRTGAVGVDTCHLCSAPLPHHVGLPRYRRQGKGTTGPPHHQRVWVPQSSRIFWNFSFFHFFVFPSFYRRFDHPLPPLLQIKLLREQGIPDECDASTCEKIP